MKHKFFTFFIFLAWMSALLPAQPVQAEMLASPLMYANGDFAWAKGMGGVDYEYSQGVVADSSGNVYTTGYFSGMVDFDPGTGEFNLTSAGGYDIFVSKLDSSGNFVWAKNMGGSSDDYGIGIAVDSSGNVHTIGVFYGTVDFDPSELSGFYLNSAGGSDIFVSKLDSSGNFLWAKSMGGTNSDHGAGIAVDSSGNVYTTGYFSGTVDFDPGVDTVNLTGVGATDIFVSKLNSGGNFIWAKSMGGSSNEKGEDIAVDSSGNVYTTGAFEGTVDFDPGATSVFYLTSAGVEDIFVSKLDSSGNIVWAKGMGGSSNEKGEDIAVDSSGNVYTIGYFTRTADFDPGPGIVNKISLGLNDIFVSKLDSSGSFAWAKSMGGSDTDYGAGIVVDSNGNVYTTGIFFNTVDFDPGAGVFKLTSAGGIDAFVSKLDSGGNFAWAKGMGGTGFDFVYDIATDSSGNVHTTGRFSGTVDFDSGAGVFNLSSVGYADIFVSKLNVNETPTFSDVPSGYWAWRYVERLYAAGITGGCVLSPLQYCPDSSVTRAQMAIFLLKGVHLSLIHISEPTRPY